MKDSPEFNVDFVAIVERYPLIYDYNSNDYSNRNLQDKAWEQISKEVKESVHDCKERWKNITGTYTRHLKYTNVASGSAAKKKKPYYLAEHMTFLLPFTKSRTMKSNIVTPSPVANADNSDSEFDNTDELSNTQTEEGLESESSLPVPHSPKSSNIPDSSASASAVTRTSLSAKVLKKSRVSFNKSGPTIDDVNKSALDYFESRKASHQRACSNEQKCADTDVLFLLSLLPDLKKMNDNQKRRYKVEMLTRSGKILGDAVASTSPPDNVCNTGTTNEFTSPLDNVHNTGELVDLDLVTTETSMKYLSQYLQFNNT